MSDIDGTLIGSSSGISQYNIDKINYFIENGGLFTIATGRCVDACRELLSRVSISAPAAVTNGALIYDFSTETVVGSAGLDDDTRRLVCKIASEKNPLVGIEIHSRDKVIDAALTKEVEIHNLYEDLSPLFMGCDEALDLEWNKAFFTFEEGYTREELREKAIEYGIDPSQIVFTNAHLDDGVHDYMEIIPKNTDKGTGIKMLANTLGIDIKNVYGIGDFYNDIPMLRTVGCAAVVAGAPADVSELADFVSSSVDEGAVGHFIDYIEERMLTNEN